MTVFKAPRTNEVSEREMKHQELIRRIAGDCMVLMENDGTLPLKKLPKKLALYGNGARATVKGGTGSGDVNVRFTVNVEQGMKDAGFEITTEDWLNRQDVLMEEEQQERDAFYEEQARLTGEPVFLIRILHPMSPKALAAVTEEDIQNSDTDLAVYVLSRNSGEGKDRVNEEGDYQLSAQEVQNLKILASSYDRFILLLNLGGIIDTKAIRSIPGINAVVYIGQLGNITGSVVADLITGKLYPSGRLVDTWAENYEDYPSSPGFSSNDGDVDDEYYSDGIYVGYRYFKTFGVKPAYPFGFGRSYTEFSIKTEFIEVKGDTLKVGLTVKNVGKEYPGKEVVQLYVSSPTGRIEKPYMELRAFKKTGELSPGMEEFMTLTVKIPSCASYSEEKAAWILESGEYIVRMGTSADDLEDIAVMTLEEDIITEQLENAFRDPEGPVKEIKKPDPVKIETCSDIPHFMIHPAEISCRKVSYLDEKTEIPAAEDTGISMDDIIAGRKTMNELIAELSDDELTYLCIGQAARRGDGAMVGNASNNLPGAAGETSDMLLYRNVRQLQMPDGPAGLRLKPHFVTDEEGNLLTDGGGIRVQPEEELNKIQGIHYYQYCTAIPIATSLAMTWSLDLIEACGDIVGEEMEEFGAQIWLAPGMNIHRNPLCGRNFEYYSEDPLLAGKCAAADTKGVQKHAGIGTTVKHFAANSQENNRMHSNSHISERTLREIYLKGFETVIREAQPMSIMTSYNLLNGIHTANHYELVTRILRLEWGFKGFVMTDWGTTRTSRFGSRQDTQKYGCSYADACVKAGNDLTMPGSKEDVENIKKALEEGTLSRAELQACAGRILWITSISSLYDGARPYGEYAQGEVISFE